MISLIAAVARNGIIGNGNRMPWHLSEDLKHFKAVTSGHPVVMGRKTFASLGKPLPGRTNVVVTRQADYSAEGCRIVRSLDEAFALFPSETEIFVIGGGEIYRQAMPLADRLYITRICHDYEGDTRFPQWEDSQWTVTSCDAYPHGEQFPYPYEFLVLDRK